MWWLFIGGPLLIIGLFVVGLVLWIIRTIVLLAKGK